MRPQSVREKTTAIADGGVGKAQVSPCLYAAITGHDAPRNRLTVSVYELHVATATPRVKERSKSYANSAEFETLNLKPELLPMSGQFEVMIERNFSSAHQLRGYRGKCENLHGHNYKIEIYARGKELNNIGLLVDFVELKQAADDLVTYLDHKNLNELEPFVVEQNPSAENVARFVLEKLAAKINDERVQIYKVRCFETPTSVATYSVD